MLVAWLVRLRTLLARPAAPLVIGALALVLCSPALWSGLGADDHIHALIVSGSKAVPGFERDSRLDLFRFATPRTNREQMEDGVFPWWADPQAEFSFWRPLAALTHALDYRLWPDSPFLMHAQSLLWFALALVMVWKLHRRIGGAGWITVLGFWLYALDDARGAPVSWVANRHALIANVLAFSVLLLHHRAHAEGWRPGAWLAPLLFGCSLFASEGSIAISAYLFAHAVFLARGPLSRRAVSLVPYLAVIVVWRVVYRASGYGMHGSGVYIDPLRDPLGFAAAAIERLPILWLGQLAAPWSEIYVGVEGIEPLIARLIQLTAIVVIALVVSFVVPVWRRDPVLRFWVTGGVLATVPACSTFPSDRLLSWCALGFSAALARVVGGLVEAHAPGESRSLRQRLLLGGFALFHLVLGPLLMPARAVGIAAVRGSLERPNQSLPTDPSIEQLEFVYVNPPVDAYVAYFPVMRATAGVPRPRRQRWLATGATEVHVARLDERTLRVTQAGGFLPTPAELMLRSSRHPFAPGDRVELSDMSVEVEQVVGWRPQTVRIRFATPLEDPARRFFCWKGSGFVPFQLPAVGATVTLPPINPVLSSLGDDWPFDVLAELVE